MPFSFYASRGLAGIVVGLLVAALLDYYSGSVTPSMYVLFPVAGAALIIGGEYLYTFYLVFIRHKVD